MRMYCIAQNFGGKKHQQIGSFAQYIVINCWQIKFWLTNHESPNPPKFSTAKVLCYKVFTMIMVVYVLKFYERFDYGVSFITLCFIAMQTAL